jgi:DNA gyrase subunit B
MAAVNRLSRRYPRQAVEQLLNLTPLLQAQLTSREHVEQWSKNLQATLELQRVKGTTIRVETVEDAVHQCFLPKLLMVDHGLASEHVLNYELFLTKDYQVICEFADVVGDLITRFPKIQRGGKSKVVNHFSEIADWLLEEARRGLGVQRYKGLGEMNPEQLWDTTMNPETRRMLRVSVQDVVGADEIFTTLMGDKVEPRRDFIEANALNVENLDV